MPQLKSQRDEPGTQREFETIYILRADATSDQIQAVNDRVKRVLDDRGGRLIRVDNWGKRKLAYEISKQLKGIYLYWRYLGDADLVHEVERNLRMVDLCIRYFTVKVDEDVNPDARPTEVDDEAFAAAATVVPDEEDAYIARGGDEDEDDDEDGRRRRRRRDDDDDDSDDSDDDGDVVGGGDDDDGDDDDGDRKKPRGDKADRASQD